MTEIDDLSGSFVSPESSTISGACYDASTRTLTVSFRSGRTYGYQGVDPEVWTAFLDAPSKGSRFARFIRPLYDGKVVE